MSGLDEWDQFGSPGEVRCRLAPVLTIPHIWVFLELDREAMRIGEANLAAVKTGENKT